jgi:hypothetical protein
LPAVIAYQYIPIMAKIIRSLRAKKPGVPSVPKKPPKKAAKAAPKKPPKPKPLKPKPWTPAEVYEAFSRFRKANPEPKGELEHLNPYTLLVAVVLSAQATDAGVNKATRALFAVADTPEKMLEPGEEKVREYIKTIGLYRNKARNVIVIFCAGAVSQLETWDYKPELFRQDGRDPPDAGRDQHRQQLRAGERSELRFRFGVVASSSHSRGRGAKLCSRARPSRHPHPPRNHRGAHRRGTTPPAPKAHPVDRTPPASGGRRTSRTSGPARRVARWGWIS